VCKQHWSGYVPSQIVSGFFAQVFRTQEGVTLDGVIYPRAVMPGGTNLVLFPIRDYERKFSDLVELRSIEILEFANWSQLVNKIGKQNGINLQEMST
jgi:hypothetical protein